jgi:ribonuclease J
MQIRDSDVGSYPPQDILCLATGSQGEPAAALSRIAIDDHRHVKLSEDDTVVLSARSIPGNEKAIGRVINHIARRGADVVHEGIRHVHVSGHGSEEELKLMLSLVRPRHFVPIHGEYRQLSQHARIAERVFAGRDPKPHVLLAENGDILHIDSSDARIVGKAPAGRVLIDGTRTGEVGGELLRDRRHLAEDGLVVPVVAINKQTGALEGVPEVVARGFVMNDGQTTLADSARMLADLVEQTSVEERTDLGLIKGRVRVELRRFIRKRSGRRPLVVPVIMEI